jgi:hypothetical protein
MFNIIIALVLYGSLLKILSFWFGFDLIDAIMI